MKNNIFLRGRGRGGGGCGGAPKPVLNTPAHVPIELQSTKYNPDVMQDFNKIKDYKIGDIKYSKETWKAITQDNFNFVPDKTDICGNQFKLLIEKPDHNKVKNDFELEFIQREEERKKIEEKNRKIKEKMLENVMHLVDEICDNDVKEDIPTFEDLKMTNTKSENLVAEKEDFNKLLDEINNI